MKVAYESKVHATHEPAAPINIHVLDLISAVGDALDYADGRDIADLIRQPSEQFTLWARHDDDEKIVYLDGVDRALKIRGIHQKISDVVGLAPVWQKRHAPCPQCRLPTLGMFIGGDTVQCGNDECLTKLTLTEYEQYCIEESK